MTKTEFIEAVHSALDGKSKKETAEIVQATFDVLEEAIRGGRFMYPGFGTFTVKERAARQGRNPQNGAPIQIAASKSVGFKAAPKFKASL